MVTYGLQSGAAAALHEDVRYKPSLSGNVWKRTGHALLSTVVLETPRGNDIAYRQHRRRGRQRIRHQYLPSGPGNLRLVREPGTSPRLNLLGFAQGNLWTEFKPDIKHLVRRKLLHRTDCRLPRVTVDRYGLVE